MTSTILKSPRNRYATESTGTHADSKPATAVAVMVTGWRLRLIKLFIWTDVLRISIVTEKNLVAAFRKLRLLYNLKKQYREDNRLVKYALVNKKYYFSYNAPGWPSKAFDRYIQHQLTRLDNNEVSLHTLIFGITTKCGFACEHCFEWKNLNTPETLSFADLFGVIKSFRELGVSMLQVTGGEPLNRFKDIISLVPCFPDIEMVMYTSGYQLTADKAGQLQIAGLKGVTISLDHWIPALHDSFRGRKGAFDWVVRAAENVFNAKMVLCLSLCATNEFVTETNLYNYYELAKRVGASFIQILEPKAVGHYAGKPVALHTEKAELLEAFYTHTNFNPDYADYPGIIYHGFYSKRMGCSGAGRDYLYVDMSGYAHNCPFSEKKLFNVLNGDIREKVAQMKAVGCNAFSACK